MENGRRLLFLVNNNVLHMLLEWIKTTRKGRVDLLSKRLQAGYILEL
jgi:hypothetical protein